MFRLPGSTLLAPKYNRKTIQRKESQVTHEMLVLQDKCWSLNKESRELFVLYLCTALGLQTDI